MIKVLVVEDDPMVGKLHEHYLTKSKVFNYVISFATVMKL